MNILSLFNGISGLHLACDRAGINVDTCYYSEIDKYANKVTEHHYPNDVALGDVTKWREWDIDWASIDLVGAGFPCQAWSVAGKQLGDKDERGMLFWTTLEIIAHVLKHNPSAKFLMENVKMKKDFEQYITHHTEQALGKVEKTLINSALVSAQNRQRYYWTNFEVTQPDDKGVLLKDVLEQPMDERYNLSDEAIARFKPCKKTSSGQIGTTARDGKIGQRDRVYDANGKMITLTATIYKQPPQYAVLGGAIRGRYIVDGKRQDHKMKTAGLTEQRLEVRNDGKTNTLTTVQKDNVVVYDDMQYRKLTPVECERLQTLPEIKKSVIIKATKNLGEKKWFLDYQKQNVNAETTCHKLQNNVLIAEEKKLNQYVNAATSNLNTTLVDQEIHARKSVHISLGENQLLLNYQGDQVLRVNIVELLKKQVHPALEENIAQEIAGINLILEKILLNGKGESQAKVKNSTHQNDGKKNVGKYGKEITHHARDAESNVELAQTDMFTTSDHGQNSKPLDLNLQILFCYVLNVMDSFTQEEIQSENSLEIKIDYSCGFTAMVSNTQRYKSIGNGWTIDVIAHILKHI